MTDDPVTDEHRGMREMMGAYLLSDLDDDERARLRAHLDGCAACRAELASLTPVVTALADVDPDSLADEPTPDPTLEQRVLLQVADETRRQRRSRLVRTGALAVAAAVLAVVAFGIGTAVDRTAPTIAPSVALEPVAVESMRPGIDASADLVDHSWGIEIKLAASGLRDGVRYRGTVRDAAGREYPAGGFLGVSDTIVLCNMTSPVMRDDAVAFVVRTLDGRTVLRSQL